MAHDLRTPINAILNFNSNLQTRYANDERALLILKLQRNSCMFISSLVEDILDLSRIEFQSFELSYSQFPVKSVIDDIFSMVELQAK